MRLAAGLPHGRVSPHSEELRHVLGAARDRRGRQGVDVVGEALSCVIIDRIPFASPGDPVVAARIEALQRRGIDAFAGFQVPLAILTLLQGVGRLIRHRQDRGVIALLDPRLRGTR